MLSYLFSHFYLRNLHFFLRANFFTLFPYLGVVSLFLSLRVDKMYDQHLSWSDKLADNETAEYQQLEYESGKAVSISWR